MVSQQKALMCAETLTQFCKEQSACQNCIFRLYGESLWKCHIDCLDLQDVLSNIRAKKRSCGYL